MRKPGTGVARPSVNPRAARPLAIWLHEFDVGRSRATHAVLLVQERPQVDHAHVAFAYAEQITRDDRPLKSSLSSSAFAIACTRVVRSIALFGETVVAFLDLILIVRFDRAEIEPGPLERVGRVLQMVRETEYFVALAEEHDGRRTLVFAKTREQAVDVGSPEALVVLHARNQEEM